MDAAASGSPTPAVLKTMLLRAKKAPISMAMGLGAKGLGVLMLDPIKPPRAVENMLKTAIPDVKNTRFGTAEVDAEENATLVRLRVNKAVSGMALKLVKTLKGTGFTKVVIMLEDGTVVEGADDPAEPVEGAAADAPSSPPSAAPALPPAAAAPVTAAGALQKALAALIPRIPAAAGDDAARRAVLMKFATDANVNIKTNNLTYAATAIRQLTAALDATSQLAAGAQGAAPAQGGAGAPGGASSQPAAVAPTPSADEAPGSIPPAPPLAPPTPPAFSAGDLQRLLATLIPRIAPVSGTDAALRAVLAKFATDANVAIKTNNLTYAATYIRQLQAALTASTPPVPGAVLGAAAGAPSESGPKALSAARAEWTEAMDTVDAQISALQGALRKQDIPALKEIADAGLNGVTGNHKVKLMAALMGAGDGSNPAAAAKLISMAKAFASHLSADERVAACDNNPFGVQVTIRRTLLPALKALNDALRTVLAAVA